MENDEVDSFLAHCVLINTGAYKALKD